VKTILTFAYILALFSTSCATTNVGNGVSLEEAIELSMEKIAADIPSGSRVVIAAGNRYASDFPITSWKN
jgi:hypothetical protein